MGDCLSVPIIAGLLVLAIAILAFPDVFYAEALSIANITFPPPTVTEIAGDVRLMQAAKGQQVMISTTAYSNLDDSSQEYMIIMEVRDETGITTFLAWSSGVLQAKANQTIGVSFIPHTEELYSVRVFAITDFDNPQVLSPLSESSIRVGDEKQYVKVTIFDDYPVPTAETLTNYTKKEAAELQGQVCGEEANVFDIVSLNDTDRDTVSWLPQELTFESLEPRQTIFRQGCSISDHEVQYVHFIMRNTTPTQVYNHIQLFQTITSAEQALEYLAYFSVAHMSKDTRSIIASEQQFESATAGCDIERNPPIKDIRITEEVGYYHVELNVYDSNSGEIYHHDWQVPTFPSSDAYALGGFKIGQC